MLIANINAWNRLAICSARAVRVKAKAAGGLSLNNTIRHHPRKRVTDSRASEMCGEATAHWIARFKRAMTFGGVAAQPGRYTAVAWAEIE